MFSTSKHCLVANKLRISILDYAVRTHVHTVQELTDILVLAQARLASQSCGPRRHVDVHPSDNNLVLCCCTLVHFHSWEHVHNSHTLLPQIVSQLDGVPTVSYGGVDWKMRIDQAHPILELLCDSIEQVSDVTTDTAEHGKLLALRKIHPCLDLVSAVDEKQLDGHVLEISLELAMLTLHGHVLGLDCYLDTLRDCQLLLLHQRLHTLQPASSPSQLEIKCLSQ